jgi:hypothetical protein
VGCDKQEGKPARAETSAIARITAIHLHKDPSLKDPSQKVPSQKVPSIKVPVTKGPLLQKDYNKGLTTKGPIFSHKRYYNFFPFSSLFAWISTTSLTRPNSK